MEITELWRAVRTRWVWIVTCVFVSLALMAGWSLLTPTKYEAKSQLLVVISGGGFGESALYTYSAERLAASRTPTYAQLIVNREVLTRAAARIGRGVTPQDLQQALTVQTSRDIPILEISVVDRDPQLAVDMASDLGEVFSDYIRGIEGPEGVDISIEPTSIRPEVAPTGSITTELILAGLAGLVVGVAAVMVAAKLDRRLRTGMELETLGLPFLGAVDVDPSVPDGWHDVASAEGFRRVAAALISHTGQVDFSRLLVTGVSGHPGVVSNTARGIAAYLAESGVHAVYVDTRDDARADVSVAPAGGDLLRAPSGEHGSPLQGINNLTALEIGSNADQLRRLLAAGEADTVVQELSATGDITVIDAPSPVDSAVGVAVGSLATGCLIVAIADEDDRDSVDELLVCLGGLGVTAVGIVLCTPLDVHETSEPTLAEPGV